MRVAAFLLSLAMSAGVLVLADEPGGNAPEDQDRLEMAKQKLAERLRVRAAANAGTRPSTQPAEPATANHVVEPSNTESPAAAAIRQFCDDVNGILLDDKSPYLGPADNFGIETRFEKIKGQEFAFSGTVSMVADNPDGNPIPPWAIARRGQPSAHPTRRFIIVTYDSPPSAAALAAWQKKFGTASKTVQISDPRVARQAAYDAPRAATVRLALVAPESMLERAHEGQFLKGSITFKSVRVTLPAAPKDGAHRAGNPLKITITAEIGAPLGAQRTSTPKPVAASKLSPLEPEKPSLLHPPLPPPSEPPVRPSRTPIDVTNSRLAYNELADLASFAFALDQWGNRYPNAVGPEFQPDPMRQLDAAVRFDRLAKSPDPQFVKLVGEVHRINVDVWRLNWGNQEFGWSPTQQETLLRDAFLTGISMVASSALDEALAPKGEIHSYTDSEGNYHQWKDPDPPSEPSARTNELERITGNALDNLSKDRDRRLNTYRTLGFLRESMEARLADIWADRLMPALERSAGPVSPKPLVAPELTGRAKSALECRNVSGVDLHNVTIAVQLKGEHGGSFKWYAHRPVVNAGQRVLLVLAFGFPAQLDTIDSLWFREHVDVQVSTFCDEGRDIGEHAQIFPTTPPPSAHAEGISAEKMHAGWLKAESQAPELLRLFSELYPTPRNPDPARLALLKSLRPGVIYAGRVVDGDQSYTLRLKFDQFQESSPIIHAQGSRTYPGDSDVPEAMKSKLSPDVVRRIQENMKRNDPRNGPLMGKFVEETDRGCVIGLVEAASRAQDRYQEAIENQQKHPRDGFIKDKIASLAEAMQTSSEASFQRYGRVLTGSTEARNYFVPGFLEIHKAESEFFRQQLANAPYTKYPIYVVFADRAGNLWLQIAANNKAGTTCVQLRGILR